VAGGRRRLVYPHGRRNAAKNHITPEVAYERLMEFLAVLGIGTEAEQNDPE